jgi:hypothetical protein
MPRERKQGKTGKIPGRTGGPRALAAQVGGLARKVGAKHGFAEAGLITGWAEIVGPDLAASCWPDKLTFPRGRRDGGSLRIRASGGLALELQHMEPLLLERINGHFGYRAVERIAIVNMPAGEASRRPAPKRKLSANPEDKAVISEALSHVEDPEIRAVLARLGDAVISDSNGGKDE